MQYLINIKGYILLLIALASITAALPLSAQTSCLAYPSGSTAPNGYGTSWGVFSGDEPLLVSVNCPSSGNVLTLTVGRGHLQQYVYKDAYAYINGAWVRKTLSGEQSGDGWIAHGATAILTAPSNTTSANPFYFVGYVCTHRGADGWKCGCRDAACTQSFWQLQAYTGLLGGSTGGSGGGDDSWSSTNLPVYSTGWSVVGRDRLGWLDSSIIQDGKLDSEKRFSIANAPDGSSAIKEVVEIDDIVYPPGWDTPPISVDTNGRAYMLRYQIWMDGYQGRAGKFFSLMGGRGMAGAAYSKAASTLVGDDGWGHVTMHARLGDNFATAKNAIRGYAYSFNRADLGGTNGHGDTYGNDSVPIPQGRWVTVDTVSIMNSRGNADGEAQIYVDGRKVADENGVMWYGPNGTWKTLWMRWRNMYGGTEEEEPAKQNVTQYYRNFELWVNK